MSNTQWELFDRLCVTPPPVEEQQVLQNKTRHCIHCNRTNFIYEDGECCCTECGAIVEDVVIHSMENSFASEGTKNTVRVGMPENPLLPRSSLGSMISARGRYIPGMKKMCQYHQWNSMPYRERSLWSVYNKIMNKARRGGISKFLIDEAKSIYKSLSEVSISRGSNRNGLIAACVYVSCKRNNVPRSVKEIANMFDLTEPELTKGAKKLHEIMNMCRKQIHHTSSHNLEKTIVKTTGAVDFIDRFCSTLEMSRSMTDLCSSVATIATDLGIVDENTPPSVASGCIFLVVHVLPGMRTKISKKKISKACNISEVTIGKCFKKLHPYRTYLFSKENILQFKLNL